MIPLIVIAGLGLLATGCEVMVDLHPRTPFPEKSDPNDALSHDPCSLKGIPDVVYLDPQLDAVSLEAKKREVFRDLEAMKKINPGFLCGLDRIELMGHDSYFKAEGRAESRGVYHPSRTYNFQFALFQKLPVQKNFIRLDISEYDRFALFHEIGHHVHNLGIFAPTISQFKALSQNLYAGEVWKAAAIAKDKNIFISPYAAKNSEEDFGESFAYATVYPLSAGMRFYLPSSPEKNGILGKKITLIAKEMNLPIATRSMNFKFGEPIELGFHPYDIRQDESGALFLYLDQNQWMKFNISEGKLEGKTDGTKLLTVSLDSPYAFLRGETLSYFKLDKERVTLQNYDPRDNKNQVLQSWELPYEIEPIQILKREDSEHYLIEGLPSGGGGVRILSLVKGAAQAEEENSPAFQEKEKTTQFSKPAMLGNLLVQATKDFRFLSYDLEKKDFFVAESDPASTPKMDSVKRLFSYRGHLVALATAKNGKSVLIPMERQK